MVGVTASHEMKGLIAAETKDAKFDSNDDSFNYASANYKAKKDLNNCSAHGLRPPQAF